MTLEKLSRLPLRLLNWIAQGRSFFLIPNFDKSPYLLRVKIRGYLPPQKDQAPDPKPYRLSIYLHRFLSRDLDRDPHSHPWAFSISIVLAGGYTEEKRNPRTGKIRTRRLRPGMINILHAQDFHRITQLHGPETWTLFFAWKKVSAWGFLFGGYFVRARDYLAAKGYADDGATGPTALPAWLLTCACCEGSFPPPGHYYVRTPKTETLRIGVRAPVCDNCARLPYIENGIQEENHVGI